MSKSQISALHLAAFQLLPILTAKLSSYLSFFLFLSFSFFLFLFFFLFFPGRGGGSPSALAAPLARLSRSLSKKVRRGRILTLPMQFEHYQFTLPSVHKPVLLLECGQWWQLEWDSVDNGCSWSGIMWIGSSRQELEWEALD